MSVYEYFLIFLALIFCGYASWTDLKTQKIRCWGDPCVEAPIDGLSVRFLSGPGSWRFNLRESNTEPLLRLNVETIADAALLIEKTTQISKKLESIGGSRETKFRWETEKFA